MSQSKPVSFTSEELELISWAAKQPGGFSKTVKRALRLLRDGAQGNDALASRIAEQVVAKIGTLTAAPRQDTEPVKKAIQEDFDL